MIRWWRSRLTSQGTRSADAGSAIIEFVFVAVVVLVPLIYVVVAAATIQRNQFAVSQAARDAGRAYATSDSVAQAVPRAEAAARIVLHDTHLDDDLTVRFVAPGAGCDAGAITPQLTPGAQFTVCVIRYTSVPGVPTILAGHGIRSVGEYVVHVDDYRTVAP